MLEAMAGGLPVIATRHGGIPEAVEHGSSGLLVAEGGSAEASRRRCWPWPLRPTAGRTREAADDLKNQTGVLESLYRECL